MNKKKLNEHTRRVNFICRTTPTTLARSPATAIANFVPMVDTDFVTEMAPEFAPLMNSRTTVILCTSLLLGSVESAAS